MSDAVDAGATLSPPTDACLLTVELTQPVPGTMVCAVTGAITADTAPVLSQAIAPTPGSHNARHLIIDMSGVTCLDADGLYILLVARHRHRTGGGAHLVVVINLQSATIAELYLVSLQACFEVYDTLLAALHACATTVTHT